eukprot:scaffold2034_cov113-Skeletonema_dohrnii-CCMP3373.AAC.4
MIRKARKKCSSNTTVPRGCQPTFKKLDLRDSHYDVSLEPIHKFAGAYCNFGGLNNLSPERIGHLANELSELIYPGGKCNFKRAFRRLKRSQNSGTAARVAPNTKKQTVYFYSPGFMEKTFTDTSQFRVMRKRAIGLTLPPSLWSRSSSKKMHPSLLSFLSRVKDKRDIEVESYRTCGRSSMREGIKQIRQITRCETLKSEMRAAV